jgi:hypothetical protein
MTAVAVKVLLIEAMRYTVSGRTAERPLRTDGRWGGWIYTARE